MLKAKEKTLNKYKSVHNEFDYVLFAYSNIYFNKTYNFLCLGHKLGKFYGVLPQIMASFRNVSTVIFSLWAKNSTTVFTELIHSLIYLMPC